MRRGQGWNDRFLSTSGAPRALPRVGVILTAVLLALVARRAAADCTTTCAADAPRDAVGCCVEPAPPVSGEVHRGAPRASAPPDGERGPREREADKGLESERRERELALARASALEDAATGWTVVGLAMTPLIVLFAIPLGVGESELRTGGAGNGAAQDSQLFAVQALIPSLSALATFSGGSLIASVALRVTASNIARDLDVAVGPGTASLRVRFP